MHTIGILSALALAYFLAVLVHELGHYLAARIFGIRVERMFVGYDAGGLAFLKFNLAGTVFGIGWVPIGGYTELCGTVPFGPEEIMEPWKFFARSKRVRIAVLLSGVAMNMLTCAACIYLWSTIGWKPHALLQMIIGFNLMLFACNVVPFGMNDGARVRAILQEN
jgi:membrane-associated protease RseP (regulator of RpoE activity)